MTNLERIFRPKVTALVGGAWADVVEDQSRRLGYGGEILRVHPTRTGVDGARYYRSVLDLPRVPDCAVIAVDRRATVEIVRHLAEMGAGGAVCLASGFAETGTEQGRDLEARLVNDAREMPFLGPNCYGYINYLDRVAAWPDQIGSNSVDRGVALISQSGTIAFTLMSNQRSLPIGYLVSIGNQSKIKLHHLIHEFLSDERVSAIGMYVEGITDLRAFIDAANAARAQSIPLVILKAGKSELASKATQSHTNSLTGSDELYDELFRALGVARCDSLPEFTETLKYLHVHGVAQDARTVICGCSGGDIAMASDQAKDLPLEFSPFSGSTFTKIAEVLGPRVTVANPLDYHTYIWKDGTALRSLFSTLRNEVNRDAVALVLDLPDPEVCDISSFRFVLEQFVLSARSTIPAASVVATLPETLGLESREFCLKNGIAPLQGMPEALRAIAHAGEIGRTWRKGSALTDFANPSYLPMASDNIPEDAAKRLLTSSGVSIPRQWSGDAQDALEAASRLGFPLVAKALRPDLLHKTEAGGVILNIRNFDQAEAALAKLKEISSQILLEEYIDDAICELLVGIKAERQFGQVLVLGSGGVLAELIEDTRQLLLPASDEEIINCLQNLKVAKLIDGYRGGAKADMQQLVKVIRRVIGFASERAAKLALLEINPLLVRSGGAEPVVVDVVMLGEDLR